MWSRGGGSTHLRVASTVGQIDINGDGTMEWDEFTSFIVETGMHGADADTYTINQCVSHGSMRAVA